MTHAEHLAAHPGDRKTGFKTTSTHLRQTLIALAAGLVGVGTSHAGDGAGLLQPLELKASVERWRLPAGETMGMSALGVSKKITEQWSLGVESRAAISGERGGFITLGVSSDYVQPVANKLALEAGLSLGAGGGRGGAYLSGGGLITHAHAGLRYDLGRLGWLSGGVSSVRFPNGGVIRSTQPYLGYSLPFDALMVPGAAIGEPARTRWSDIAGYTPRQHQVFWVARQQHSPGATGRVGGGAAGRTGLIGAEWRTLLDDGWFVKLESEGAASGQSAGYMQILAGGGRVFPLTPQSRLVASLSLGGGGGGGVDTGGGLLVDGALGWQYQLSRQWLAELSASRLSSPSSSFRASSLDLRLGYQFGAARTSGSIAPASDGSLQSHSLRLRTGLQNYRGASPNWRTQPQQGVSNLALQLDYMVSPHWYLSGQGVAAQDGGAGAYMAGLLGAGARAPLSQRVFAEAELLAGAAGGGGLNTGSGLATQANLNLGVQLSPALALVASLGRMQAANGEFRAKVAGLSLAYSLNAFTPQPAGR